MATRIITAIIAISIGIVLLCLSDTIVLYFVVSAISCTIIVELFRAEKITDYKISYAICILFAALFPFTEMDLFRPYRYLFVASCILLLFVSYLLQYRKLTFDKLAFMITTTTLVSLAISCMITLKNFDQNHGAFYIVLMLMAAWVADAGAYFVGTFFGKHKLCPGISPKKTIEGAVGGVFVTGIILALTCLIYQKICATQGIIFSVNYPLVVILGMVSAVLGMMGDLVASLLKRQCQIKDFGHLMPGHGGILDRFDSVLFVAPFICIILTYFQVFH